MAEEDFPYIFKYAKPAPTGAYVAPPGAPPGAPTAAAPAPKEPSMRARALAEILSQTRYTVADSGPNQGDRSTLLPKFYANMNNVNTQRYGGNYMPSDRFDVEVRPEDNDGEYLYSLMNKLGAGVAENFATGGSPGDSDEDMQPRNMTRFMRKYQNAGPSSSIYVPEDDLMLAMEEIYAKSPGVAPGQTGSRTQPGQSDKAGSVGGENTPGATLGSIAKGFKNATGVLPFNLSFLGGLYNSMKYGHFAGPGYGKLDKDGNVIPGTYKGGAGYSPGRRSFTGPGGQTGQAGTGSDGPSGGGGGIST
tara:strand:- start:27 stop:941 length:915 start_codon:yes stop_codon:yes gene_type:complete